MHTLNIVGKQNYRALGVVTILLLLLTLSCNQSSVVGNLPTSNVATPTTIPNGLFIDANQTKGSISPLVYGTNYGPWITVPFNLLPQAQNAGITYLRFPGGNWGDKNNLRDYHIDQFITLAQQMSAVPSISVRLQGGSTESAAQLVQYTLDNNYNIQYWSIGNEPALYGDYDTERYNTEWRAIAEAMLAVNPNITLIGPDVTQYTGNPTTDPKDENGRDWMEEFLKANGEATPDSFYNAVWWADVVGRLINQNVEIVAHFALQSPPALGGWGLFSRSEARPTYYVYQLYQQFGSKLLYATSDSLDVSVYAAQRKDEALTFIIINLGATPQTKQLHIANFQITQPAQVWLLDADHKAEKISDTLLKTGQEITLPPQSITLYILAN